MSHIGFEALLITGFLSFWTAQGKNINLCKSMRGTEDWDKFWQERTLNFFTRECEWGDKSLLLTLNGDFSNCRVTLRGETFCHLPTQTCFVISVNYNTSSNPTKLFPNCKRIIWTPKTFDLVQLSVTYQQRPSFYQYKFTSHNEISGTHTGAPTIESSNAAVIALAVLFTLALIAVFVLLIIVFKERVIELGKDIRSRFDKPSEPEAAPNSNAVYAVAEEPSIYHEVGTANSKEVVQNELYAMT